MGALLYQVLGISQRSRKMLFVAYRPSIQMVTRGIYSARSKSKVGFPLSQKDCCISSLPLYFVKDVANVALNANPSLVSMYAMRTFHPLISSAHTHAIRSLSTAEVSSSVEEDERGSLNAEENLSLESKYRELDSLCKSVEELDEQIERLKEQRRNRLAELEMLKVNETDAHGLSPEFKEVNAAIGSPAALPLSGSPSIVEGMHSISLPVGEDAGTKGIENVCIPESSAKDATGGSHTEQFPSELLDLAEERVELEKLRKKPVSLAKQQSVSSVKKSKRREKIENGSADSVVASLISEDLGTIITTEPKKSKNNSISSSRRKVSKSIKGKHETEEELENEIGEVSGEKVVGEATAQNVIGEGKGEEVEKGPVEGIREDIKVVETQERPSEEEIRRAALEASEILAQAAGVKSANQKPALSGKRTLAIMSTNGTESAEDGLKLASTMPKFQHPLPEWIVFLEDLFQKGYFGEDAETLMEGEFSLNLLHRAVTDFGRDRDDIFRLLPVKDLKVIANFGCPSLDRKPVNSSKRLRAFFGISEGDVCQQCMLKSSCVRAFASPSSEIIAGTLDVVRVVLSYAEQLMPNAESQISYSEDVKKSFCNLLKKFVELSATPRDPNLPKPEIIESRSVSRLLRAKKGPEMERTERVPGKRRSEMEITASEFNDWTCPNCDYLNFARKKECRNCGTYRPHLETQSGSWECPNSDCKYMNFSRNRRCRECGAFRPRPPIDLKPGDWECPNAKCGFMNFAKNDVCLECKTERPTHELGGSVRRGRGSRDMIEDGWGRVDKPLRSSYSGTGDVRRLGSRVRPSQQNEFDSNAGGRAQRSRHKEWKPDFRKRDTSRHDDQEDDSGDDIEVLEKEDIDSNSDSSDDADGSPYSSSRKCRQSGSRLHRRKTDGLSEDDGELSMDDDADEAPHLFLAKRHQSRGSSYRRKIDDVSESEGEPEVDSGKSPKSWDHGRERDKSGFSRSSSFEGKYRKNTNRARDESSRDSIFKGRGGGRKSRR